MTTAWNDAEKYQRARIEARVDRWLVKTATVTLEAAELDLVIEQGRRFYLPLQWFELRQSGEEAPYDLTGWTFTLKVAKDYGLVAVLTLTATISEELIKFELAPAETAVLTGWTRGVYDVVATKTGDAIRLVQGTATLSLAAAAES